ncbi:MAG: GspH/FimT family pseudopilin [Desulfobacterales bacterium]|nr:GspH/FimT family pseudopilin [Desulfobacterales bacterium]
MRFFRKGGGQAGITLIELAVVMAIIAIMGLFMAPAIGEWMDNYRIRQTARDIASTLQLAKMQAISTRTAHVVTFIPAAGTYQITPGGDVKQMPRGVIIDSTDFTDNKIQFNPNGTSSSLATAGIYINNTNGKQYRVRVSPSGNISMQEGWT